MEQYILALDQGTTNSRAFIFNREGKVCSVAKKELVQIIPKSGWVEIDPMELWASQVSVAAEALSKLGISGSNLAGIGITNQRETTIVWDKTTGIPIYNAIIWSDRRTSAMCSEYKKGGFAEKIKGKTGLVIDSYFSATKIKWILDNVECAKQKAENGELAFGTVDSWLVWKLTQGRTHITDVSNASRTMLFNINTLKWDNELLEMFDIPSSMLPRVCSSSEVYDVTNTGFFAYKVPIASIAGDQQASLFGHICIDEGMVKNTYGTGCFILANLGNKPLILKDKLLTTIAWKIGNETTYALEGSVFTGGSVVHWLRDSLGIIRNVNEIEKLALQVENSAELCFVPAFTGMGAPYWNQSARGTIVGMNMATNSAHIARASLESIAFQIMDVLCAMQSDYDLKIKELRVDGSFSDIDLLLQFQADILKSNVIRPKVNSTAALGAAYLAGIATGFWQSIEEIKKQWEIEKTFIPTMPNNEVDFLVSKWNNAVECSVMWANKYK